MWNEITFISPSRAGYLICRYLIDRLDWEPDTAIRAFDTALGEPQSRPNFLADLRRRV